MTKNKKRFTAVILAAALALCGCSEGSPASGGADTATSAASSETTAAAALSETTAPAASSEIDTSGELTALPETPPLTENDIRIYIQPDTFPLGTDSLELKAEYIGNAEYAEYMFGADYELEKQENGGWRTVPFNDGAVFADLAYLIGTDSLTNSIGVSLSCYAEPLTEGLYRVKKTIEGIELYAEFTLTPAPDETTAAMTSAAASEAVTSETTAVTTSEMPAVTTSETAAVVTTSEIAAETTAGTSAPEEAAQPEILLFMTYDNYAWGYQQNIAVFAADGKIYISSADDSDNAIKHFDDDWYAELSGKVIAGGSGAQTCDEEIFGRILSFSEKLPQYEKLSLKKDEEAYMFDYGTEGLYGVYTDGSGNRHKVEIASYGDSGAACLDSSEVREFVNYLADNGIFSMMGGVFAEDGSLQQKYVADSEDGSLTLRIDEITDDGFICYLPWPYPARYYVICDPSEYPDFCVDDNIEVEFSIMYRKYDDEFDLIVYPLFIYESSFALSTDEVVAYKPVIYLYPGEPTDVSVKLDYKGKLTVTYPQYNGGWNVTAMPDGTLFDKDGNEYSYLFWEGKSDTRYDLSSGYCVRGSDCAAFLREKLSLLGLTPREYNEFIVFWLPYLQDNEYNVISFQFDSYTDSAALSVSPEPDTVLRVFMAFYASDKPVDIPEQELVSTERKGFTVVEWGGSPVPAPAAR